MRMLIEISNSVGPWVSEICTAFWLVASIALLRTWYQSRTPDALIVLFYLTSLLIAANLPTWADVSALAVIHLLLFTALVWCHGAHGLLRTVYGARLQNMAALIVFADAAYLGWDFYIQYHGWLLAAIFLTMCISSLYVSLKAPHNGGNLGKSNGLDTDYHKIIADSVKV